MPARQMVLIMCPQQNQISHAASPPSLQDRKDGPPALNARFLNWLPDPKVFQPDLRPSSCASPPSLHGMTAFRDKAAA
jgi:hypothetical protein